MFWLIFVNFIRNFYQKIQNLGCCSSPSSVFQNIYFKQTSHSIKKNLKQLRQPILSTFIKIDTDNISIKSLN